jgi:hypothetical protein
MMELSLLPPDPQSDAYLLDNAFWKGGGGGEVEETRAEKAAAEVAMKRYTRYAEVYRPFEEKAFADITSEAGAQRFEDKVKGQLAGDAAQMYANYAPKGLNPSLGASQSALGDPNRSRMVASSLGKAEGLGRDQQIAGLQAAVNVGTGQANDVQLSYDELAKSALDESIGKQVSNFNERAAKTNATMTGIGALTRAGLYAYDSYKPPTGSMAISGYPDNDAVMSYKNTGVL